MRVKHSPECSTYDTSLGADTTQNKGIGIPQSSKISGYSEDQITLSTHRFTKAKRHVYKSFETSSSQFPSCERSIQKASKVPKNDSMKKTTYSDLFLNSEQARRGSKQARYEDNYSRSLLGGHSGAHDSQRIYSRSTKPKASILANHAYRLMIPAPFAATIFADDYAKPSLTAIYNPPIRIVHDNLFDVSRPAPKAALVAE